MRKEILFSMESPYRDTFRIWGYRFGEGKKTLAIVGAMRGDEIHQQFVCARVIECLAHMEADGQIAPGNEILVIPSANPFSMNIEKRFWALDGTDINRMFPGYDLGETTQRIASGLFESIKDYEYGVQLASSYMSGIYIPHIRIMKTGFEDVETARNFGLQYIALRTPRPFDTTTLNYNWQIWETKAYSLYGGMNNDVTNAGCSSSVNALLRFMYKTGITTGGIKSSRPSYETVVVDENTLKQVEAPAAGIFQKRFTAGEEVSKGETIAQILDPYEGHCIADIKSPCDGIVFYVLDKPLALLNTPLFTIREFSFE